MPAFAGGFDPWAEVDDVSGTKLYEVLGVKQNATPSQIRTAYRSLARVHHPDKPTGDATKFGELQKAFEVLSDVQAREAYDTCQREIKYRYIPGVTPRAEGGEDLMLDELERLGLACEPSTQLVVVCEVCGRPSTKECYVCTLRFCDFCTRKQHWKGRFRLHWPVHNVPGHMATTLAKRQLEQKRLDDARRLQLEDPNWRSGGELSEIREFKEAAAESLRSPNHTVTYDLRLAKYCMWAQTARFVYVAVYVPTGYQDKALHVELTPRTLLLQPEDSPPVINRALAYPAAEGLPVETINSEDKRVFAVAIPKGQPGQRWDRLFQGDSDWARCMEPPYRLLETSTDTTVELELPFWIDNDDVRVKITATDVDIEARTDGLLSLFFVRNTLRVRRTFWRNEEEEAKADYPGPVDAADSDWSLMDSTDAVGNSCKLLLVVLAKPPLTSDEVKWKKGIRQDNRVKPRRGEMLRKGWRFFADDEDEFGLEDVLQALCFVESGETFAPPKPWELHGPQRAQAFRAFKLSQLSETVVKQVELLLDAQEKEDGDDGGGGGGPGGD